MKRPRPQSVGSSSTAIGVPTGAMGTATKRQKTGSGGGNRQGGSGADLKERFIAVFDDPRYSGGVTNNMLKEIFSSREYPQLVPIMNELTACARLVMSKLDNKEVCYDLVSPQLAAKMVGLDPTARLVYQVIEKAGNKGIWTRDVRSQTRLQLPLLNKVYKALESRQLIKNVKTVSSKKVYMLYDLRPATELTGGPWYTDQEFDHEFVQEMRSFLVKFVRGMNKGRGVTMQEIKDAIDTNKVSKESLGLEHVQSLVQSLAYDYLVEERGTNGDGEALYVMSKRVNGHCDFKWWDVLSPDFSFREIRFEDGVTLSAHEPHHHTA